MSVVLGLGFANPNGSGPPVRGLGAVVSRSMLSASSSVSGVGAEGNPANGPSIELGTSSVSGALLVKPPGLPPSLGLSLGIVGRIRLG